MADSQRDGHGQVSSEMHAPPILSFDDLDLDPSDPLNFLVQNMSSGSNAQSYSDSGSFSDPSYSPPSSDQFTPAGSPNGSFEAHRKMDFDLTDYASNSSSFTKPDVSTGFNPMNFGLFNASLTAHPTLTHSHLHPQSAYGMGQAFAIPDPAVVSDLSIDMNGSTLDGILYEPQLFSQGHAQATAHTVPHGTTTFSHLDVPMERSRRHSATSSVSSTTAASPTLVDATPKGPLDSQISHTPQNPNVLTQPPIPLQQFSQEALDAAIQELVYQAHQATGINSAIPSASIGAPSHGAVSNGMDFSRQGSNPPAKLPIPRLARAPSIQGKPLSPASLSSSTFASHQVGQDHGSPSPMPPKPKTSHTTIERRYRTNLNARIQALRNAVPALRVLEMKDGNRVGNLGLKAGIIRLGDGKHAVGEDADVIDERGFVDGVKVARKGSKANVLGKAVEYIRVLKKREGRLRREQEGLRSLIFSLVGGDVLLAQWEKAWKERYGGPEADEVEDADMEADDENDDVDDDESLDEENGGKKRKRAKADSSAKADKQASSATVAAPVQASGAPPPEKKKRGRPRKAQPPPPIMPVSATSGESSATSTASSPNQQSQYLLATFALFTFFNAPGSNGPSPVNTDASHSGVVLGPVHTLTSTAAAAGLDWRSALQYIQMFISLVIFVSVLSSHPVIARLLPRGLRVFSQGQQESKTENAASIAVSPARSLRSTVEDLENDVELPASQQATKLRTALGVRTGPLSLIGALLHYYNPLSGGGYIEGPELDRRAWLMLVQLTTLDSNTSYLSRAICYLYASRYLSRESSAILARLAILIHPISTSKAGDLWAKAQATAETEASLSKVSSEDDTSAYDALALESRTIDEAVEIFKHGQPCEEQSGSERYDVMKHIVRVLVREHIRTAAEDAFIQLGAGTDVVDVRDNENASSQAASKTPRLLSVGRTLDPSTAKLIDAFKSVCVEKDAGGALLVQDVKSAVEEGSDAEIYTLLNALAMHRRIFNDSTDSQNHNAKAASSSSPSPSHPQKHQPNTATPTAQAHAHSSSSTDTRSLALALRRVLDFPVFYKGDDLEFARDCIVDLLTASHTLSNLYD